MLKDFLQCMVFMLYKNANSSAILVAILVIALTLVTAASFNHSYSALAVSNTGGNSVSSSSATTTTNPKALSKNDLNSLIDCINTANNSRGLTHKVLTNCLDTVKGITSSTSGAVSTASTTTPSSPGSITPQGPIPYLP
jgi:hypothetical protein